MFYRETGELLPPKLRDAASPVIVEPGNDCRSRSTGFPGEPWGSVSTATQDAWGRPPTCMRLFDLPSRVGSLGWFLEHVFIGNLSGQVGYGSAR